MKVSNSKVIVKYQKYSKVSKVIVKYQKYSKVSKV